MSTKCARATGGTSAIDRHTWATEGVPLRGLTRPALNGEEIACLPRTCTERNGSLLSMSVHTHVRLHRRSLVLGARAGAAAPQAWVSSEASGGLRQFLDGYFGQGVPALEVGAIDRDARPRPLDRHVQLVGWESRPPLRDWLSRRFHSYLKARAQRTLVVLGA